MPETGVEPPEISKRHTEIIGELSKRAVRHVAQSDSLELLDPQFVNLDHHNKGFPIPYETIREKASEAFEDFPAVLEQFNTICAEADALTASTDPKRECNPLRQVAHALERGENVIYATNHYELTDIAKMFAATCVWLCESGYEHLLAQDSKVQRALIASQIASVIGVKMLNPAAKENESQTITVPIPFALMALVHHLIKSYPNTKSVAEMRKLWEAETKLNNLRVKSTVSGLQKTGSLFLAMAPSGSQDKSVPGDPTTFLLEPLKDGTLDMMKQEQTHTLFMGMWYVDDKPIIQFSGKEINDVWVPDGLVSIKSNYQGNAEMANLAGTLNYWVPGRHFVYLSAKKRR
jgi:hypothetical protein